MRITIAILGFFITMCTIGKQRVSYNELSKKPSIQIEENLITITIGNSTQNSALVIYKIDYSIDKNSKHINLKGFQALKKEYKDTFEIEINGVKLNEYKFHWTDPDNKKTLIQSD